MSFSLDHLRAFVAAAESGSFSSAARTLNRAQSSISTGIMNLEIDWDVELFDRSGKYPQLTDAGKSLLPHARTLLERCGDLDRKAASFSGHTETNISIIEDEILPLPVIFDILNRFSVQFPNVDVELSLASPARAVELVRKGEADMAISAFYGEDTKDLSLYPITDVPFSIYVSPKHPLAQKDIIRRADLEHYRNVSLLGPDAALRAPGVSTLQRWKSNNTFVVFQFCLQGHGWAVLPTFMTTEEVGKGNLLELRLADALPPTLPLYIITNRDSRLGKAGQWLFERIIAVTHDDMVENAYLCY